jgi:hypothetical protein
MRCPVCQTEHVAESSCPTCDANARGRRKPARRRAIAEEVDSPFSSNVAPVNWPAVRAYRVVIWGLIPGAGAVLGPLGALLGWQALRKSRHEPAFTAHGPARAALWLGMALAVTNWLGLVLIYLGLHSRG